MEKNLGWKFILILVLVAVAAITLYPPHKKLKPGIDLAGGTSLIYEIDTTNLKPAEKRDIAERMITVLRRRIDPANIQNLIWRPLGSTRFEIQMPLASQQAREKREQFEQAMTDLLEENINLASVMRSLKKEPAQRQADFQELAGDSEKKQQILDELVRTSTQLTSLQAKRDQLADELQTFESKLSEAGYDWGQIKTKLGTWTGMDETQLAEAVKQFAGDKDTQLLLEYVQIYRQWAQVLEDLTDPQTGANVLYRQARAELDQLNLSKDQVEFILSLPENSTRRNEAIQQLKAEFPTRSDEIDRLIAAHKEYLPHRGRLDDPKDLQRMLKGAGILEYRILPTQGDPSISPEQIKSYIERLATKGPTYASDNQYIWLELETQDPTKWGAADSQQNPTILGQFGDKYYVLASNKSDETMLHSAEKSWSLERAYPDSDHQTGRSAIGFSLDERGGKLFFRLTANNIGRPLCIVLDDTAISAPTIQSSIQGTGIITGSFTSTEISDMVDKLNAGSLPSKLIEQPISVKNIGPSIGEENRDRGIKAGIIGLIIVAAIMLLYYLLAGAIADAALFLNILLILAVMALLQATFTLPGIAGIILTIGMSVDANVLIFERIREEQLKGSSLRIAIRNGYQRAFSTILDANLTTFITAAILYWVASEEIKGFAIVLMIGIISSMFTALFVTRVVFDLLLKARIVKDHLVMLHLIKKPNINWMALRPVFFIISLILIGAGLFVFFTRDETQNNKYDIEFTGGTSVTMNLVESANLSRQEVEDRLKDVAIQMNDPALAAANVYSVGESGDQFEITTTQTNVTYATVNDPNITSVEQARQQIRKIASRQGARLSNLDVAQQDKAFTVSTSNPNKNLLKQVLETAFPNAAISEPQTDEVVSDAIVNAFGDVLEIQLNLEPKIINAQRITERTIDSYPELMEFLGGIRIEVQTQKAATPEEIQNRISNLRFKPDLRNLNWYAFEIYDTSLGTLEPNEPVNAFAYVSVEPEAGFRQLSEDEWTRFEQNETTKIQNALSRESSLPRTTQIDPSVGSEAKTRALIAIILSLIAIVAYIWFRFGNVRYGLAAIAALVHDVCITLGAVTACTYIASTGLGQTLLIEDFKINLAIIAALLTIIGYSLNDTIVVFDRIRENRRKKQLTPTTITESINQTLSRTLMTSFTTFVVVLIMYIFGGSGLRGFTFSIGLGIIIGTYSSVAIAAPILLIGTGKENKK